MHDSYIRVMTATPELELANCPVNADRIIQLIQTAAQKKVQLLVFPELTVTGATCGDLFLQPLLLNAAAVALQKIINSSAGLSIIALVGLPFVITGKLYNVCAVIYNGQLLGIVPKTNKNSQELRYFSACSVDDFVTWQGYKFYFGQQLFCCQELPDFIFAVEIGTDLYAPNSPSQNLTLCGATVIANLSATCETVNASSNRRLLLQTHSQKYLSAYVYCDAGSGESTTDQVFGGQQLIAESGAILAESPAFSNDNIICEIDLELITNNRHSSSIFTQSCKSTTVTTKQLPQVFFSLAPIPLELTRKYQPHPFVPTDSAALTQCCKQIFAIQVAGLLQRLRSCRAQAIVIGLSGGLDSCLAFLVAVATAKKLYWEQQQIIAVTMPGLGTTSRTRNNAIALASAFNVNLRTIDIKAATIQHFKDIGQDLNCHDATFENSQARERTQILMDIANQVNGLVVGTGDLSELALGWATYNGDHMSMYGVNSSVPKTLVRYIVAQQAKSYQAEIAGILQDILATPVSPELLPSLDDKISQATEDIIGPYELHDFFLYFILYHQFSPEKLLRIAKIAFDNSYSEKEILKWLTIFIRRFFTQQFKRSCMPDGPKVMEISLSPRGDWHCPSDVNPVIWNATIDQNSKLPSPACSNN